jgi:hypothetical protein
MLGSITALRFLLAHSLPGDTGSALLLIDLPFNPLRLMLLVAWFYLCVYFVQRCSSARCFENTKPMQYRTLFTGPSLLTYFLPRSSQDQETGELLRRPGRRFTRLWRPFVPHGPNR